MVVVHGPEMMSGQSGDAVPAAGTAGVRAAAAVCTERATARDRRAAHLTLVGWTIITCVAVVAVHWPVRSVQTLSFDDSEYLIENGLVQNPGWKSAKRFFTEILRPSSVRGYYQPFTMISLMLDCALGGRPPDLRVFHRTNLMLHASNTALIVAFLYLLFGRPWAAVVAGLLFGVHPATVESIAWIAERKTLLAAFFSLSCLVSYVFFTQRKDWRFYPTSVFLYVLALLSKPTSLPLPVLMLLLDCWPLNRLRSRAVWEKIPLLVVGSVFAIITYVSQAHTGGVKLPTEYGIALIPAVLSHNIGFYVSAILWPTDVPSYCALPQSLGVSNVLVRNGIVYTAVLTTLLAVSLRWTRAILIGSLFFFVAILPAMQIVGFSHIVAGAKYAYLPMTGWCIVLAGLLDRVCHAAGARMRSIPPLIAIGVVLLAGVQTALTRRQLTHWRDSIHLYRHMLTFAPESGIVHNNLGLALMNRGERAAAIFHYRQSIHFDPRNALAHRNLAVALAALGNRDDAIGQFRRAIQLEPSYARAYNGLGFLLRARGDFDAALSSFQEAVKITPHYAVAHFNLGMTLVLKGQPAEALQHLREALRLNPFLVAAMKESAWLLATHPDVSVRDRREAVRLAEGAARLTARRDPGTLDVLAAAYATDGQFDEAVRTAERALALAVTAEEDLAGEIRQRLELYREARPYREDPAERRRRLTEDRSEPQRHTEAFSLRE